MKNIKEHWPLIIGLLLTFTGLSALFWAEPKAVWLKVVYAGISEIGFAFIIAWIVGKSVEGQARKEYNGFIAKRQDEFREEIKAREIALSKNIFDYIYSVRLPKSVFEFVENHIFMEKIIKTRQVVEYQLDCNNGVNDDWLLMRVTLDYQLKNISSEPVDYDILFYSSEVVGEAVPEGYVGELEKLFVGEEIPSEKFSELDAAADDEIGQRRYKKNVRIGPDDTVDVRIVFSQPKRKRDNDLWQSLSVCESLQLSIRFDPKDVDVYLEPVHPGDSFDRKEIEDHGLIYARVDRPLLPRNGFFIWWLPKKNEKG